MSAIIKARHVSPYLVDCKIFYGYNDLPEKNCVKMKVKAEQLLVLSKK
jgi:hypothetical protein